MAVTIQGVTYEHLTLRERKKSMAKVEIGELQQIASEGSAVEQMLATALIDALQRIDAIENQRWLESLGDDA